jgi:hypothetical protein
VFLTLPVYRTVAQCWPTSGDENNGGKEEQKQILFIPVKMVGLLHLKQYFFLSGKNCTKSSRRWWVVVDCIIKENKEMKCLHQPGISSLQHSTTELKRHITTTCSWTVVGTWLSFIALLPPSPNHTPVTTSNEWTLWGVSTIIPIDSQFIQINNKPNTGTDK